MSTASILVIGNEILSGKVRDENSPWLAQRLREQGVDLERILVLPDSLGLLAEQIRELSQIVDHLFTSGGLGPTHDDLTMEAVAQAFDMGMAPHQELVAILETRFPVDQRGTARFQAMLQMCVLPTGAKIWSHPELFFPLVTVRNAVILPGVPHLFRRKFEAFKERFHGDPVQSLHFYTSAEETRFAEDLSRIQASWPDVEIGSYPQKTESGWRAMLTLDSRNAEALSGCGADVERLVERLEAG